MSIRACRLKAGKKVADIARVMGVSVVTVYFWESGQTKPRTAKLPVLAAFLGVTVDDLLREDS